MTSPKSGTKTSQSGAKVQGGLAEAASDTFSKAAELGHAAAGQAKHAAAETMASVTDQMRLVMDQQVESGTGVALNVAHSIKCAADDLDRTAPQLAGVVHACADALENYADNLSEQSAEDVWRDAQTFARKQPALVFGLAALAGFLAYRTVQSGLTVKSPPIQPGPRGKR